MNAREQAYSIFSQLDDVQIQGFIDLFGKLYQPIQKKSSEKEKAFNKLQTLIKPIQHLNDKELLQEYREERFGL